MSPHCCGLRLITALTAAVALLISATDCADDPLKLTQAMSDSVVTEGDSLTLSCQFQPQPSYIVWYFQAAGKAPKTLLRCQPAKNSCVVIDQVPGFGNASAEANGSLTVPRISIIHNGMYRCEGLLKLDDAKSGASVTVLAAPTLPLINSEDAGGSVKRSEMLSLNCSTTGANPAPELVWTLTRVGEPPRRLLDGLGGVVLASIAATIPYSVTSSLLRLPVDAADNQARIQCTARHPVANATSADYLLSVQYEPRVNQLAPIALELMSEALIECSAGGNPLPMVRIEDAWGRVLSGPSLGTCRHRMAAERKNQSGIYYCVGVNSVGSANSSFTLNVQYGPQVSWSPGQLTAREGDLVEAECLVDANPPALSAAWRHLASGRLLTERRLRIDSAARADAGIWRCEFTNRLTAVATKTAASAASRPDPLTRSGWAELQLTIKYPPGRPVTDVEGGMRTLLAGQTVAIKCSANAADPGVPPPELSWAKESPDVASSSRRVSSGAELVLANGSLSDTGTYFCMPANTVGKGQPAVVKVNVEQPPRWMQPLPPRLLTARVNATDFRLNCSVEAKPAAAVRWLKDGQPVGPDMFSVRFEEGAVESTGIRTISWLHFRGTSRMNLLPADNGIFQCEVSNIHGKLLTETQLMVEFPAQIEPSQQKVALPSTVGAMATLACSVIGQPAPNITWRYSGGQSMGSGRIFADPRMPYRYVSSLEGVAALGSYTCQVTNPLGSDRRDFLLLPQSPPDPPFGLVVTTASWDFVVLAWRRGFDGGSPARHWLVARASSGSGGGGGRNFSWRADATQEAANATGLMPGTNYTFQVYAENQQGRGNLSVATSQVTSGLPLPKPSRVQVTDAGALKVTALENYCMRVESSEDGGVTWSLYQYCVPSGTAELPSINRQLIYRVSLCLLEREEVCGLPTLSTTSMASLPEIPTSAIIIVGSGCAALILVLSVILLYFCCKKPAQYKEIERHSNLNSGRSRPPSMPQCQSPDGKPYALVPPHPAAPPAASATVVELGAATKADSRRSSMQKEDLMETSADRRSTVFATLRSAHNPLDSSTSNPALFSYTTEGYTEDNRNTPPYVFESHYPNNRGKRIVYEVVV